MGWGGRGVVDTPGDNAGCDREVRRQGGYRYRGLRVCVCGFWEDLLKLVVVVVGGTEVVVYRALLP